MPGSTARATEKAVVDDGVMVLDIPDPVRDREEAAGSLTGGSDGYAVYENPLSSSGEHELTLSFMGDCSIGDAIKSRTNRSSMTQSIEANGEGWLFETVQDILHADDFSFANLEVVLTDRTSPQYPLKMFNMIGKPEYANILRLGGIDGVNTVNNHCIDFRYGGYEDTMANLEQAGILHFGVLNPLRTKNSYINLGRLEIKGVRIGLIGFTYPTDGDKELIREYIGTLREEGCQIIIVSFHWGREERMTPNASQFPYAAEILDMGADMIWGHHPHVLQPVYFHDGKPVFFSTGNFVFGTIKNLNPSSGIFQLTWDILDGGEVALRSFHMVPTQVRHSKQEYRPLLLTDPEDMAKCLRCVIARSDRNGFLRLPDEFARTGTVYLLKDGSLSVDP